MTHDTVLYFSKTWGAIYLLVVFLAAVVWVYWPSRKSTYTKASKAPFAEEEDHPCR